MRHGIMRPEEWLEYMKKIPKNFQYTFWSAIVVGIIAHLYMFTNKLPNYDDLTGINAYGAGSTLGRWFLEFLGEFKHWLMGNYSMPWFNGMSFLICIGITAGLVVVVLDIQDKFLSILAGGILSSFPATAGTLFFMFTVPFYGIALVLSVCAAVLFVNKDIRMNILGIVCCVLSMGIYQAYLPVCASVLVLVLIKQIFGRDKLVTILISGIRYLGSFLLSVIGYMLITKIFWGDQLSGYQGTSEMGKLNISELPEIVKSIYHNYFQMIQSDFLGLNSYIPTQKGLLLLTVITGFLEIGYIIKLFRSHKSDGLLKGLMAVILTVIFPIAVFGIYLMCSNGTYIYAIMLFSLSFLYILPIVVIEHSNRCFVNGDMAVSAKKRKGMSIINTVAVFLIGISVFSYCQCDNEYYLQMDGSFKQALSTMTTVVTQIKEADGYTEDMPVAFIGLYQDENLYEFENYFSDLLLGGRADYIRSDSYQNVMKMYCGFSPDTIEDTKELELMSEVQNMPCYPNDGSIRVLKGIVVVKFSEK